MLDAEKAICEEMRKRGHNVLMICPTNKLVKKYKRRIGSNKFKQEQAEHPEYGIIDSTTVNKFFSIGLCDFTKMNKFDDSSFDVVVFDEIFFNGTNRMRRIYHYMRNNPDKIILGTGDTQQVPPIEKISNVKNTKKYQMRSLV